jgi:transcriptional regulator with XRE-family HTH domain
MARARRRPSAVYDEEYQSLIRRVREAREDAGMTQEAVAKALERPVSFVSKCELGERRIDPIDLKRFAELFDKPLEYFYAKPKARREGKSGGRPQQ